MRRPRKGSLLDTNVLLRFLLGDDPEQSRRAFRLMKRLEEGTERAEIEDVVIAETVWVLEKKAGVPRAEIARRMSEFLVWQGIGYRGKRIALEAFSRYGAGSCDIVDCLLAARARSHRVNVCSFDADFKKLGCAWEPPA